MLAGATAAQDGATPSRARHAAYFNRLIREQKLRKEQQAKKAINIFDTLSARQWKLDHPGDRHEWHDSQPRDQAERNGEQYASDIDVAQHRVDFWPTTLHSHV